jgi:hypothetical protein
MRSSPQKKKSRSSAYDCPLSISPQQIPHMSSRSPGRREGSEGAMKRECGRRKGSEGARKGECGMRKGSEGGGKIGGGIVTAGRGLAHASKGWCGRRTGWEGASGGQCRRRKGWGGAMDSPQVNTIGVSRPSKRPGDIPISEPCNGPRPSSSRPPAQMSRPTGS